MKAIQVTHLLSGKYQAKAEGVPAIRRSKETLDPNNPALDIATQLCNKYNWLQNGKYHLEEGCLPNLDTVFVFVKNEIVPKPDIRRDLRLLLEKYKAQLVAVNNDDHQPSTRVHIRFETVKYSPSRDTLLALYDNGWAVDSGDYILSEEAIADD